MNENKNVFDDLIPTEKLPTSAKAEVMGRLGSAKSMRDFWNLLMNNKRETSSNAKDNADRSKDNMDK